MESADAGNAELSFRQRMGTAPVMIWVSAPDKLCSWFNQPWVEFTGRTMAQERGDGWAEGIHPDDLDRCLSTYIAHFDRRVPFRAEDSATRGVRSRGAEGPGDKPR